MIIENPEDSVRKEQNGANEDAAGTENSDKAEKAKEIESSEEKKPKEIKSSEIAKAEETEYSEVVKAEGSESSEVDKPEELESDKEDKPEAKEPEVIEKKIVKEKDLAPASIEKRTSVPEVFRDLEEIELPPVDYSGFSKHELVETLALIIDNRPPSEIREDVERIKSLFYKKIKTGIGREESQVSGRRR